MAVVFCDFIAACDTQVDAAVADERGDIRCREENQRNGQVLDQSDIETVLAAELDIAACEEVQRGWLKTALFIFGFQSASAFLRH